MERKGLAYLNVCYIMAIIVLSSLSIVHSKGNLHLFINIVFLALVYCITKISSTICVNWDSVAFPVVIASFCLIEVLIGYKQLLFHNEFVINPSCVGSFDNPGPYGGFLAVCICVLTYYSNDSKRVLGIAIKIIIVIAFIVLLTTDSRAAYLSLILGVVIYLGTNGYNKLLKRYWLPITATIIVGAILAYFWKKSSADARVFIYGMSIRTLMKTGLLGVGFGNFGGAYADVQALFFENRFAGVGSTIMDLDLLEKMHYIDGPIYAFNDFLQLGIEGGWLFLVTYVIILFISLLYSFSRNKACFVGIICVAFFSLFSYPLENIEFRFLLVFLIASSKPLRDRTFLSLSSSYFFFVISAIICLICIKRAPEFQKYHRAQHLKNNADYAYLSEDYYHFLDIADNFFEYLSYDYSFIYQYGVSLNKTSYFEDSDSVLLLGSKKSCNPMFWNIMGNNSWAQGKYREAEARYKHAFYMVPNRLYPLYYLAKLYHLEGDTTRFLEMAERVESFAPKIESAKTEGLREEIRELMVDYLYEKNGNDNRIKRE